MSGLVPVTGLSIKQIEDRLDLGQSVFVTNCPFEVYKGVRALNQSLMKQLVVNPAWTTIKEDTNAFAFGRLFHEFVLEPAFFTEYYIVIEGDARTKEYKAKAKEWPTHQIVKGKDFELIKKMAEQIKENKRAHAIIEKSQFKEVSIFWKDSEYNIECKARLDALMTVGNNAVLVDLKTTQIASDFKKSAKWFDYDIQAAFYKRSLEQIGFVFANCFFVVCEKDKTNETIVYECRESFMKRGEEKLKRLFDGLIELADTGRTTYPETLYLE